MNYQADFVEGEILFAEVSPKPPKLDHLQGAMFLDRPDLWLTKRRLKKLITLPHQEPLFNLEEGD
jgi:hypothetical protein